MVKPDIPAAARAAGAVSAVALLALASACSSGGSSSAPSDGGSSTSSTSSTPGASSTAGATVNTASVTVSGAQTTVLTAPDGHTLYYFTPDTAGGTSTCTGSCASLWPALKAANPTETSAAKGTLTVVGGQVVYNGHPLYEYTGDSAAGQANGEGVMGQWYVATPDLTAGTNPMPSNSSGSGSGGGSGGGYGGY